jgi:hypothetical protein
MRSLSSQASQGVVFGRIRSIGDGHATELSVVAIAGLGMNNHTLDPMNKLECSVLACIGGLSRFTPSSIKNRIRGGNPSGGRSVLAAHDADENIHGGGCMAARKGPYLRQCFRFRGSPGRPPCGNSRFAVFIHQFHPKLLHTDASTTKTAKRLSWFGPLKRKARQIANERDRFGREPYPFRGRSGATLATPRAGTFARARPIEVAMSSVSRPGDAPVCVQDRASGVARPSGTPAVELTRDEKTRSEFFSRGHLILVSMMLLCR